MPLLHPDTPQGQRLSAWEQASQAAQSAGLPPLPKIDLPQLPDLTGGGCNAQMLEAAVGKAAADMLREVMATPEFKAQVQDQLIGQRAQVAQHFAGLERQRQQILTQLQDLTDEGSALDVAQQTLGQLRGAVGLQGVPIAADLLQGIQAACPAVGALMTFAEQGIQAAEQGAAGIESTIQSLTQRLDQITDVQAASQRLLDDIDSHLGALPALIEAATGGA